LVGNENFSSQPLDGLEITTVGPALSIVAKDSPFLLAVLAIFQTSTKNLLLRWINLNTISSPWVRGSGRHEIT
jgi:hypothetical protein